MSRALLVVTLAACSARAPTPAPISGTPAATERTPLELATAYERGDGVPRDYARAAAILTEQCRDAAGDPVACRRLLRAMMAERGVVGDQRMVDLAVALCLAIADADACVMAAMASPPGTPSHDAIQRRMDAFLSTDLGARCDRDRAVDACAWYLATYSLGPPESDEAVRQRDVAASVLCAHDDRRACATLVTSLTWCDSTGDPHQCTLDALAEWRADEQALYLDAYSRLDHACTLGDADACPFLPGRALSADLLCAAHDHAACRTVACRDTPDADACQF